MAVWRLPAVRMLSSRWLEVFVRLVYSIPVPRQLDTFSVSCFNSALMMAGAALHDLSDETASSREKAGSWVRGEAWRHGNVSMARRFVRCLAQWDLPGVDRVPVGVKEGGASTGVDGLGEEDEDEDEDKPVADWIKETLRAEDVEARRQRGKDRPQQGSSGPSPALDSRSPEDWESRQEHWSFFSMCPSGEEVDSKTRFPFKGHVNCMSVRPISDTEWQEHPVGPPWRHLQEPSPERRWSVGCGRPAPLGARALAHLCRLSNAWLKFYTMRVSMRQDMAQSCGVGFGHMRCILDALLALGRESLEDMGLGGWMDARHGEAVPGSASSEAGN